MTTPDVTTIPDSQLRAEILRRENGGRAPRGGMPRKIRPCPVCGDPKTAREMLRHYNPITGKHRVKRGEKKS